MKLRKLPSNTALLHTFTDTGVGATLVTTVYQRRKSAGPFEKVDTTTPVAL
jgi:hypothetical protein